VPGWGKLVAGAVIGAAGALYATNEDLRRQLPGRARDLPVVVRRRFDAAVAAARDASASRRAEILRELEAPREALKEVPRREAPVEAPATMPEVHNRVAGEPATQPARAEEA
jgi:hypothetical protein